MRKQYMVRIGIGYDIHRLVKGRKLFLGGIEVPHKKGLLGHSDGDVVLHAICDAILGALAAGDIGEHFPDTNPEYKGICSIELLKKIYALLKRKCFAVNNIDAVIITEEPKLAFFKKQMQEAISAALKIKKEDVSIKAKTNEGLGAIGKKEAIACYAVAALTGKERE